MLLWIPFRLKPEPVQFKIAYLQWHQSNNRMLKKIIIIVAVLAVIVVAGLYYANNRNRTLSPPGQASITEGDLTVSVSYSRPSVRGRVIFGSEEAGALQPFGAYWRLGANESTEITFNRDVQFSGNPVKAGTYRMYAVPGPTSFDIILNTELGRWGVFEPDPEKDIVRIATPVNRLASPVEQFTIRLEPQQGAAALIMEFSDVQLQILISGQ